MADTSIRDRMAKITAEHLGIDIAKITDKASFIEDLNADSLDMIELVMAYEEEFDVEIYDDDAMGVLTFADAVKVIEHAKASGHVA